MQFDNDLIASSPIGSTTIARICSDTILGFGIDPTKPACKIRTVPHLYTTLAISLVDVGFPIELNF